MKKLLEYAEVGDTVVVWRVDRLGRSLIGEASQRGYRRLYPKTGAQVFFAPARRAYSKYGFTQCEPFAGYRPDPNSVFMKTSSAPT